MIELFSSSGMHTWRTGHVAASTSLDKLGCFWRVAARGRRLARPSCFAGDHGPPNVRQPSDRAHLRLRLLHVCRRLAPYKPSTAPPATTLPPHSPSCHYLGILPQRPHLRTPTLPLLVSPRASRTSRTSRLLSPLHRPPSTNNRCTPSKPPGHAEPTMQSMRHSSTL